VPESKELTVVVGADGKRTVTSVPEPNGKLMIETYLDHLFPNPEMRAYFFDNLRPGRILVWYGTGNNGKSVFANLLLCVLKSISPTNLACVYEDDELDMMIDDLGKFPKTTGTFIYITNDVPVVKNCSESFWSNVCPIVFEQKKWDTFRFSVEQVSQFPWEEYLKERLSRQSCRFTPQKSRKFLELMKAVAQPAESDDTKPVLKIVEEDTNPPALKVPTYAPITITVKKDVGADDVLMITPDPDSDGFIVTFEQPASESWLSLVMSPERLHTYLAAFFHAATVVSDTYRSAIFDVPFFPCATLQQDDIYDYATNELPSQIGFHLEGDDWPMFTE
jgi:hypothetical protein